MTLLAKYKDSKANAILGVCLMLIALLLASPFASLVQAKPAQAAAVGCCKTEIIPVDGNPALVKVFIYNPGLTQLEGAITIASPIDAEASSSQSPVTILAAHVPTADPNDHPQMMEVKVTEDGPYAVPPGWTLTVTLPGWPDPLATYKNDTPVSTVRDVFVEQPISNGTAVPVPVPTDSYVYKDATTGAVVTGIVPIPVNSTLVIVAESTSTDVNLVNPGPWPYDYVAPAPMMALPPSAPDFQDAPGRGQDQVVLSDRAGWVYTINGGPTLYSPGAVVRISGEVIVEANLANGYAVRPGTATYYKWTHGFSGGGDRPDDYETLQVTYCHNGHLIKTSVAAFYRSGHIDHPGDIWAEFTYVKNGEVYTVPAQGNQAVLANGCKTETVHPEPGPQDPGPVTDPAPQNPDKGNNPAPQNPDQGNTPAPQDPAPAKDPAPAGNPAPKTVPVNNPAPAGNPDPQVETYVESDTWTGDDASTEMVSMEADTSAEAAGSNNGPVLPLVIAALGFAVFLAPLLRRTGQATAK